MVLSGVAHDKLQARKINLACNAIKDNDLAKLSSNKTAISYVKNIYSFEIIPIIPTLDGSLDSYKLITCKNDIVTYTGNYTLQDWIGGHGELFSAARILINSDILCDKKLDFNLYLSNSHNSLARAKAGIDCNWLIFFTECWTRKQSSKSETIQIGVFRYFLKDIENDSNSNQIHWIGEYIICLVEDLISFGKQLLSELNECLQERKKLGIQAPFDEINDLY